MVATMDHDAEIDATGLLCPLPVLKARKAMRALASGQVLRLRADDPAAAVDVPHYCAEAGHALIDTVINGPPSAATDYYLRKR